MVLRVLLLLLAAQTAKELNTQGFRLYQQQKYVEALELFMRAAEKDPKLALAHYNAAATLGVLRAQKRICEVGAHRSAIVSGLQRSIQLDPKRRARAKVDADFKPVHDTVGWQRAVLGLSPKKAKDLPVILSRVPFWGPGEGAFGSMRGFEFKQGGAVTFWVKRIEGAEPAPRRLDTKGTWKTEGLTVRIQLEDGQKLSGTLDEKGVLTIDSLGPFFDQPSECEA